MYFLIIVFIIGRQMYTSNLNTMDTVMWSLASDVTNKMITQSDKNIENNMHDVLSAIYDGNGFDIKQNIAFEYKVKNLSEKDYNRGYGLQERTNKAILSNENYIMQNIKYKDGAILKNTKS